MAAETDALKRTAPYGSWVSSLGFAEVVAAGSSMTGLIADGSALLWVQTLPEANGRAGLFQMAAGQITELTSDDDSVRSRINEYGGGAHAAGEGFVTWCDDTSRSVKIRFPTGQIRRLTNGDPLVRYGDLAIYPAHRLVLAVAEDHREETSEPSSVRTTIVAITWDEENSTITTVCQGADFYACPRLATDGRLSWVEWDLPAMPWDSSRLRLAHFDPVTLDLGEPTTLLGSEDTLDGSCVQKPIWQADGALHFMSDDSGFAQLMRWREGSLSALTSSPYDHDLVPFTAGAYSHLTCNDGTVLTTRYVDGWAEIIQVSNSQEKMLARFAAVDSLAWADDFGYAIVASAEAPTALVRLDDDLTVLHQVAPTPPDSSIPVSVWTEGIHGPVQGWYYPPQNPRWQADSDELPPLIVRAHGGPTAQASSAWYANFQFWASRGIAVLDVNYSGSTGFGRAYRNRLREAWGIADVADCQSLALSLIAQGKVDPNRVAIMGSSAGGFTALRSIATTGLYSAAISLYGVTDLVALVGGPKFESRYSDSLIGPWPEAKQRYLKRSPINSLDALHTPVLILQGTEDPVVPLAHAQAMAKALLDNKVAVAVRYFPGEGHGFSGSQARADSLRAQLSFLAQVWGFIPADDIEPIPIDNLG